MSHAQLIDEAKEYISYGYCKYSFAIDKKGKPVSPRSTDAKAYDIYGALLKACGSDMEAYWTLLKAVQESVPSGYRNVLAYLDRSGMSAQDALQILDKARAKLI